MENFYNILYSMLEYEIRFHPNDANFVCRFKKIGQVKLSNMLMGEQSEAAVQFYLESIIQHFKVNMAWSPFNLKFTQANNSMLAFITFTNNDNHLDFIRVFDKMPFLNGCRLVVKPNGFTDSQYNDDIRSVRFDDQRIGVNEFNAENYFKKPVLVLNQIKTDLRDRLKRDWNMCEPQTSSASNSTMSNKRRKSSDSTQPLTSLIKQPASVAVGRFERFDSLKQANELSDDDNEDDSWSDVKKR
jgi:hypothetical protein